MLDSQSGSSPASSDTSANITLLSELFQLYNKSEGSNKALFQNLLMQKFNALTPKEQLQVIEAGVFSTSSVGADSARAETSTHTLGAVGPSPGTTANTHYPTPPNPYTQRNWAGEGAKTTVPSTLPAAGTIYGEAAVPYCPAPLPPLYTNESTHTHIAKYATLSQPKGSVATADEAGGVGGHRGAKVPRDFATFRTHLCKHFEKGRCNVGEQCFFAHGREQLRQRNQNVMDGVTTEKGVAYFKEFGCGPPSALRRNFEAEAKDAARTETTDETPQSFSCAAVQKVTDAPISSRSGKKADKAVDELTSAQQVTPKLHDSATGVTSPVDHAPKLSVATARALLDDRSTFASLFANTVEPRQPSRRPLSEASRPDGSLPRRHDVQSVTGEENQLMLCDEVKLSAHACDVGHVGSGTFDTRAPPSGVFHPSMPSGDGFRVAPMCIDDDGMDLNSRVGAEAEHAAAHVTALGGEETGLRRPVPSYVQAIAAQEAGKRSAPTAATPLAGEAANTYEVSAAAGLGERNVSRFRTQICRHYMDGWRQGRTDGCNRGNRCNFAHGEAQLRTREQNEADGLFITEDVEAFVQNESMETDVAAATMSAAAYTDASTRPNLSSQQSLCCTDLPGRSDVLRVLAAKFDRGGISSTNKDDAVKILQFWWKLQSTRNTYLTQSGIPLELDPRQQMQRDATFRDLCESFPGADTEKSPAST